jgi:hypothetical protein
VLTSASWFVLLIVESLHAIQLWLVLISEDRELVVRGRMMDGVPFSLLNALLIGSCTMRCRRTNAPLVYQGSSLLSGNTRLFEYEQAKGR